MLIGLNQGLINIALIQLCVTQKRDHPAHGFSGDTATGGEIILHQGGKGGYSNPQTHRTGGEIDVVFVLCPTWIGLRAAQPPKTLQLIAGLAAKQILSAMEDGAGVGLNRNPILWTQGFEIERRH